MDVSSRVSSTFNQAIKSQESYSPAERKMLDSLSGPDRERMEAQLALQKQQEAVSFISKSLKNDTEMQVINSLK